MPVQIVLLQKPQNGDTALSRAQYNKHHLVERWLLPYYESGHKYDDTAVLVDPEESLNELALDAIDAARAGELDILKYIILIKKVSINTQDDKNRTLLMWAACKGHVHIVKYLIEHEAQLNKVSSHKGMTALLYAADQGHLAVVKALVNAEADRSITEYQNGDTALCSI